MTDTHCVGPVLGVHVYVEGLTPLDLSLAGTMPVPIPMGLEARKQGRAESYPQDVLGRGETWG